MPITADQNADLQKQYDALRAQGKSTADATSAIRDKLKSTVVENPTAGTASTAFDMMKSGYKSGGVEGDWIGNGPIKADTTKPPTPIAPVPTPTETTPVATPPAQETTPAPTAGATPTQSYGETPYGQMLGNISSETQKNVEATNAALDAKKQAQQAQLDSTTGSGLTAGMEKAVLSPYEQFTKKLDSLHNLDVAKSEENRKYATQQYNDAISQQTKINEQTLINANRLADATGVGFDSGGVQGINGLMQDNQQKIASMQGTKANMLAQFADVDARMDIDYLDKLTTLQGEAHNAIKAKYADVVAQIQAVDAEKGKNTKEGLEALRSIAKDYAAYSDQQYKNAFDQMKFETDQFWKAKEDVRNTNKDELDYKGKFMDWVGKTDISTADDSSLATWAQQAGLNDAEYNVLLGMRDKQAYDKTISQEKDTSLERVTFKDAQGNESYGSYNKKTGQYSDATGAIINPATSGMEVTSTSVVTDPQSVVDYSINKRGRENLQCGELVNDYWEQMTGKKAGIGNSYSDKLGAVKSIGYSDQPQAGGIFVSNPLKNDIGHTGIIQSVNEDGSITVLEANAGGSQNGEPPVIKNYPAKKAQEMIFSNAPESKQTAPSVKSTKDFTDAEVTLFNSSKYNPQTDKNKTRANRYDEYQNSVAELSSDPNADTTELMRASKGGKSLSEAGNKIYKDIGIVVSQLGGLKTAIDKYNKDQWSDTFAPITGLIANNNPWDTKAQDIKARLQAVVPKVARGVMGEVGVLTDQDIANYIQTLPNIKQTADTQDVIQLALLGTVKASLDNAVRTDQATYDVSKLTGSYKNLSNKIKELEGRVLGNATPIAGDSGVGRWQASTGATTGAGTTTGRWQGQ